MAYNTRLSYPVGRGAVVGNADHEANVGLAGKLSSAQIALASTDPSVMVGAITDGGIDSGDYVGLEVGIVRGIAGEAIAIGDRLTTNSSSQWVKSDTIGDYTHGIALSKCDASGDEIEVRTCIPQMEPQVLTLTVGTEAADVIAVTVQGSVAHASTVHFHLRTNDMLDALVGAWTMAETGAGAEVSTTAKPSLLVTLSAAGAATVSVTDVGGGSGVSVYLFATVVNEAGVPAMATLTFD